jgi:hypothetical protein
MHACMHACRQAGYSRYTARQAGRQEGRQFLPSANLAGLLSLGKQAMPGMPTCMQFIKCSGGGGGLD